MKKNVIVFAGTTEGRLLCEFLEDMQIESEIYVPIEYKDVVIDYMEKNTSTGNVTVKQLDKEELKSIVESADADIIIDGTPSEASMFKRELRELCEARDIEYYRLVRRTKPLDDVINMPDTKAVLSYLNNSTGNILLGVRSCYFKEFASLEQFAERVYVHIPFEEEMIKDCREIGVKPQHMLGIPTPISEDLMCALLKEYQIHYLVLRDTDDHQAFEQKRVSAKRAGAEVVVIARPKEESGYTLEEVRELFV